MPLYGLIGSRRIRTGARIAHKAALKRKRYDYPIRRREAVKRRQEAHVKTVSESEFKEYLKQFKVYSTADNDAVIRNAPFNAHFTYRECGTGRPVAKEHLYFTGADLRIEYEIEVG